MKLPKASAAAETRLRALAGADPRITFRKMFGQPAAFVHGNLCMGTFGGQIFLRLSAGDVETLSKTPGVRPFEPMPGRAMKHYLVLPPAVLNDAVTAKRWALRSIEFVETLPAK